MTNDHTLLCSEPTADGTPVGADFYMTEDFIGEDMIWSDYGPYGFLTPMHNVSGKGYFHCYNETNKDHAELVKKSPYVAEERCYDASESWR